MNDDTYFIVSYIPGTWYHSTYMRRTRVPSTASTASVARYSACGIAWHRRDEPVVVAVCGAAPVADVLRSTGSFGCHIPALSYTYRESHLACLGSQTDALLVQRCRACDPDGVAERVRQGVLERPAVPCRCRCRVSVLLLCRGVIQTGSGKPKMDEHHMHTFTMSSSSHAS